MLLKDSRSTPPPHQHGTKVFEICVCFQWKRTNCLSYSHMMQGPAAPRRRKSLARISSTSPFQSKHHHLPKSLSLPPGSLEISSERPFPKKLQQLQKTPQYNKLTSKRGFFRQLLSSFRQEAVLGGHKKLSHYNMRKACRGAQAPPQKARLIPELTLHPWAER